MFCNFQELLMNYQGNHNSKLSTLNSKLSTLNSQLSKLSTNNPKQYA